MLRDEPGTLDWSFETNSIIFKSSPMIDSFGNIYFGNLGDSLYSLSPTGELNWAFPTGSIITASPAILPDGRICFGSRDHNFYMLNNDGSISWSFDAGSSIPRSGAVRYDGIIYFSTDSDILYALNFGGGVLWSRNLPEEIRSSPVLGPDGTIYLMTLTKLYALDENGVTKWYKTGASYSDPVVDGNRIYYFNNSYLKAVDFNGNSVLSIGIGNINNTHSTPAIGKKGNIYFGTSLGQLMAYNRNGLLLWYTAYEPGSHIKTGPLIDDAGNIYYGCNNDNFYSIASDGSQNWVFQTNGSITSSPAITSEGNLVFGSYDGNLYCLNGYESELSKYASPMYGVNCSRTFSHYSNIYPSRNRILFDYTIVNTTEEDTLIVYNNTDETVQIFFECNSNIFQVSLLNPSNQIAPNDSLALLISFQPMAEEVTEANLIIYTNDENAPKRNIYLYGNGVHLDMGEMIWNLPFNDDKMSSPAMDDNGVIYFVCGGNVYAVSENQQILWNYYIGGIAGSYVAIPIITPDNKILIVKRSNNTLHCINNSGNLEWIYESDSDFYHSPAVDLDGNIFITNRKNLISLSSDATERWIYHFGNIQAASSPSISADGTIYYSNSNSQLIAVTKNGLHKFTFQGEEYFKQPVIDDDGTIYITSLSMTISKFYAIHPDGSLINQRNLYGWAKSPAIIGNDYIYYALQVSGGTRIYSLDKETFSINWTSQLISGYYSYSPTLASDGSIFITGDASSYNSYLSAIDSLGHIKWEFNPYELEFTCRADKTPLIHSNGNIIMASYNNARLFAILENVVLADSPWPTLGQNATHSSMAKNSIISGPDILVDKDNLDFGIVEPGSSESLDFTIFNDGDSLLVFTYELTGEGFSIPNMTRYTLSPGDSIAVEIVFAPLEDEDPIHHGSLIINSNDYDQPLITISLFGRSNLEGTIKWKIRLMTELQCTPAIDDLGNIYIFDSDLYCIAPDGEIKWVRDYFRDRYYYCRNVTISDDNEIIYVPPMRAVDSTGVLLFNTPVYGGFATPIALDADHQLYFGKKGGGVAGLYAFNSDGEALWNYHTYNVYASPIIDPEGNIFFIGSHYSDFGGVYSFDSDGNMNWSESGSFYRYSLALGFDNKLFALDYVCPGTRDVRAVLKCFDTEGNFYWEFMVPHSGYGFPATSPVIDEQGNIYFANTIGELYSIDPEGNMNWYYEVHEDIQSTPAIAANGVIYLGCNNGALYAINSDGTLRWSYQTESEINDHIVVTDDGMIYFTNETGYLYAIHGLNGGLADSPWPMIHQNPKHNCRLDEYYVSCDEDNIVPKNYCLINYPNPFNPSTTISFFTAEDAENAKISIYNIKGQKVKTLNLESASHSPFFADGVGYSISWNGNDENNQPVSSGIYFYQLKISEKVKATKKCLLLK